MNKHTPGPWRVDRYTTAMAGRAIEAQAFDGSWKYIVDRVRGGSPEEADHNARLVAAAPDLYEAIASAMEYLDQTIGPCDEDCECILHALHAAIAKAEGRS